ncbi:MAG: CsbD family protein [Anaerolineales bacterium]
MTEDILKGQWKQIRGQVQEEWGELTDDEVDQIQGRRDQLIGKLQEKYGYTKKEAEDKVDDFLEDLD